MPNMIVEQKAEWSTEHLYDGMNLTPSSSFCFQKEPLLVGDTIEVWSLLHGNHFAVGLRRSASTDCVRYGGGRVPSM